MSAFDDILARHGGNKTTAAIEVARGLMRGDPSELKAGYSAANAALAVQSLYGLNDDQLAVVREAIGSSAGGAVTRMISTTVMSVKVGDEINLYHGAPGKGEWVEGVVSRTCSQAGPEGSLAVMLWLGDAAAPLVTYGSKDVRIVATAQERELIELRAEYVSVVDALDAALARLDRVDVERLAVRS